jgi:L-2-hydroxyglutarate oxidase LhgO
MKSTTQCQTLIIGAGITGLTIARELLSRGASDLLIIEKEKAVGLHASGRNSGVLHAGIYYTPDSLKARFCVEGNRLMKAFCREKKLLLKETGKVIVTQDASQLTMLDELYQRAKRSGTHAQLIDAQALKEHEPYAFTHQKALYSPDTAVINPKEILRALVAEIEASGRARIAYETKIVSALSNHASVETNTGTIKFSQLVNAAGAHADRIAQQFGLAQEYKILPFKGTYRKLTQPKEFLVRSNIYPVPDLRNPFLGVHLTRTADDHVYGGPTAIPAFGRENYGFLDGLGKESFSILYRDAVLFAQNEAFRGVALREPKKYLTRFLHREAQKLMPSLRLADLESTDKVGIRPQLVHWPTRQLVMDFVVLTEGSSLHILNAISPAFTSSMSFAKYIVDRLSNSKEKLECRGGEDALSVQAS